MTAKILPFQKRFLYTDSELVQLYKQLYREHAEEVIKFYKEQRPERFDSRLWRISCGMFYAIMAGVGLIMFGLGYWWHG